MKKIFLLKLLVLYAFIAYGQQNNTTNTKFINGIAVPNGATEVPSTGLTAGALFYKTGVGFMYYNGSAWITLGIAGAGVTSVTAGYGLTPQTLQTGAVGFRNDSTVMANKTWVNGRLLSYAPISGSGNYIQNQNSAPQTATFWITGDVNTEAVMYSKTAYIAGTSPGDNAIFGQNFSSTGYGGYIWGGNNKSTTLQALGVFAYDGTAIANFYKDTIVFNKPVSLVSGLAKTLTLGYGITGTSYNGSANTTATADTTSSGGLVSKSRMASFTYTKAQADARFDPIGSGVTSITGTANQITASAGTGAVTLSIPNSFTLPSATPTFSTVTATTFTGALVGNATTATALATSRTIGTVTGDATSAGSSFDGTANNTNALTLATVNASPGTYGSATQTPVFVVTGKGLVTSNTNTTITPAVGSITGLGSGVATALAVNVGSAGAFITFNGNAGTPSALVGTNITGTASGLSIGGNAASATVATTSTIIEDNTTNQDMFPVWVPVNTSDQPLKVSSTKLIWHPSTSLLTIPTATFTSTGQFLYNTGATTSNKFLRLTNTSGDMSIGVEGATAAIIPVGGTAYSSVLTTVGSTSLILGANSLPKVTIPASGAVVVSAPISIDGLTDLSSASAGQIKFPATQNASSNVNTLDDYEEGAWTPTATFAGGNGDLSYTTQVGQYTKIGRQVTCTIFLIFSETTASGALSLTNLPFTSTSITNARSGSTFLATNLTGVSGGVVGQTLPSSTSILVYYAGTGTITAISNTNTSADANFIATFTYFTD